MRTIVQSPMPLRLFGAVLALTLISVVAATATPPASIEAAPPPPPFVDVSVESEPVVGEDRKFTVIVTNNLHPEFLCTSRPERSGSVRTAA